MNKTDALLTLGNTAADAVLGVLSSLTGEVVAKGELLVMPSEGSPLASLSYPLLATDVTYTDGVIGGNVFTIARLGVRRLAAAMMSQELPTEDRGTELDEIELSALGEAMNQMMAASAAALSTGLGYAVDISAPTTRTLDSAAAAEGVYPQTPHATSMAVTLLGEPCNLIQLIPDAFLTRISRALEGDTVEPGAPQYLHEDPVEEDVVDAPLATTLRQVTVRVTAELGRTRMRLEDAANPLPGTVIELDRAAEDPVDLCVSGQRFATGRLLLTEESEWALRIERLLDINPTDRTSQPGG